MSEDKKQQTEGISQNKSNDQDQREKKEEIKIPEKFKSIVNEIEKMSVLDLSELVKILEDKFNVSSVAPMIMASGSSATEQESIEEKTEFTVELTSFGDNKISVIKSVREVTEMGLKDAKDLVESAPVVIKEGVKKENAEEMKKKIEGAGGQITVK